MDKNEVMTCTECGCTGEELVELSINGETRMVCKDCAEALGFKQCSDCGEWVLERNGYKTYNGDFICDDCYCDGYFTCEDCGEIFPYDEEHMAHDRYGYSISVCDSCLDNYCRCDDCGEYFHECTVVTDDNDHCLCERCFSDDYYRCADCGEIIHMNDVYWGDNDEPYCEDCIDNHKGSSNFHDYSYKPFPEFHVRNSEDENKVLYLGVELEVDKGDDQDALCDELAELCQPIYMKHDGSLDEGVEIVTHPCSLAYHTYELRWAEIDRICKANNFKSHDAVTCGLHIHVGRDQMGNDVDEIKRTAGNLVLLANTLKGELTLFSRRGEGELNHWAKMPNIEIDPIDSNEILTIKALDTKRNGRYQAVNLCNCSTVEFRFFRGTLKRSTLIASLQLASNLTKYAMTHTPKECTKATWKDVVAVEEYKELAAYSASRGL